MSLNEMRLANILFEPEDKYVHLVNEAILNEAVEDVQGYIESLNILKNGLVGHPEVIKAIDELQDKLIEAADEGSGRLARVFGNKTTKLATAASELTKNLFDLYKKISLSPKVKPQFELSKTKLQSSQLALKITFTPTTTPAPVSPLTRTSIQTWIKANLIGISTADAKNVEDAMLAAMQAAAGPTPLPENKRSLASLLFEADAATAVAEALPAEFKRKFLDSLRGSGIAFPLRKQITQKVDDFIKHLNSNPAIVQNVLHKQTSVTNPSDAGENNNDAKTEDINSKINDYLEKIIPNNTKEDPATFSTEVFNFVLQNFDALKAARKTSLSSKEEVSQAKESVLKNLEDLNPGMYGLDLISNAITQSFPSLGVENNLLRNKLKNLILAKFGTKPSQPSQPSQPSNPSTPSTPEVDAGTAAPEAPPTAAQAEQAPPQQKHSAKVAVFGKEVDGPDALRLNSTAAAVEDPDSETDDGTEKMNELLLRLRKLVIKEMYSLSLQSLFKDDFKSILSEAAPPSGLAKNFIKFDQIPADADDSDSILSDLMILHKPSSATNATYDFSSLGINGIDEIEIPSDIGEIYITGLGSDNDAAPLPERFSSNVSSKTTDKALGDLEFNKLEPIIKKSVESINKSLKKAGAKELPAIVYQRPTSGTNGEFALLKMLQFTSNYKLLEKMMAAPSTSSGLSGPAAAAAGAAAVGAAAAGLAGGGASGGSSGSAGAGGGAGGSTGGGRGAPRHSLKNALSGIGIDDAKIEVIKDRINPLVGYIFNESVSYDQNRLEVLAGIRKK